jgi:beta-galactosidase GanA
LTSTTAVSATPAPQLVKRSGRHALLVDGSPYLVLGAQIGNSSAWPEVLPEVWAALEALHVNTAEAPIYWEQMEPEQGHFDWTNVDALLNGARSHHLHLILLWFGTWKNGNDHYAPIWVKRDPTHFPRMRNSYGTPLDVLSANATSNLDADRRAFTALTHYLAERDGQEHTVLMIQVENESGAIGTVRDYSPDANREYAGPVPADLVKALQRKPGTWADVFPGNADEVFQAWTQARYINAIAEAGKRELPIPMYCNVWLAYPPAELPERRIRLLESAIHLVVRCKIC